MKDSPLKCTVENNQLIISIGVDTLAFADKERTGFKISNPEKFAADVVYALGDDDEIGASLLSETIDKAMQKAADDGSMWIER